MALLLGKSCVQDIHALSNSWCYSTCLEGDWICHHCSAASTCCEQCKGSSWHRTKPFIPAAKVWEQTMSLTVFTNPDVGHEPWILPPEKPCWSVLYNSCILYIRDLGQKIKSSPPLKHLHMSLWFQTSVFTLFPLFSIEISLGLFSTRCLSFNHFFCCCCHGNICEVSKYFPRSQTSVYSKMDFWLLLI